MVAGAIFTTLSLTIYGLSNINLMIMIFGFLLYICDMHANHRVDPPPGPFN